MFQGAPPSREEFSHGNGREVGTRRVWRWRGSAECVCVCSSSSAVDEEFEDVATQVLSRTCAMVNKYRRLLMVEAEVGARTALGRLRRRVLTVRASPQRSSPSSEMVMIDRTFNQEERRTLTQDKRLVLVDPGRTREAPAPPAAGALSLTPPLLLCRQLPGRLLLWDEVQTVPGSSPLPAFVQL